MGFNYICQKYNLHELIFNTCIFKVFVITTIHFTMLISFNNVLFQARKKFNVNKYPINVIEEEKLSEVFEDEGEFQENDLENKTQTQEIVQEA